MLSRLTFGTAAETDPVWSPNGKRIYFTDQRRLLWKAADGTGNAVTVLDAPQVFPTGVSCFTARPSRDLITAAHPQLTLDWWENRRSDFDLYISQLVVAEAGAGDQQSAARRREVIRQIPLLELNAGAMALARAN